LQITIDMQLLLTLLVLVGIALGIFLIVVLVRLIGMFKRISRLVDDIHGPIASTVDQLPELMIKVDAITDDLVILTESANQSLPAILKDAQAITGSARAGVEAIGDAAKQVGDGVSSFFNPEPKSSAGTLGTIVEVVSQVISVISLFAGRRNPKDKYGRRKKRRR
jgi:uncharacterized protein YoxC